MQTKYGATIYYYNKYKDWLEQSWESTNLHIHMHPLRVSKHRLNNVILNITPGGVAWEWKKSMCGTRMRFRGRRPRSFKTFRCGKKCMIYAKGWEVLKLSDVAQIWSYKAKCWRARRALNATYLILFLILVPQMHYQKLPHICIKKFATEQKKMWHRNSFSAPS